jgi:hypothetical protein
MDGHVATFRLTYRVIILVIALTREFFTN